MGTFVRLTTATDGDGCGDDGLSVDPAATAWGRSSPLSDLHSEERTGSPPPLAPAPASTAMGAFIARATAAVRRAPAPAAAEAPPFVAVAAAAPPPPPPVVAAVAAQPPPPPPPPPPVVEHRTVQVFAPGCCDMTQPCGALGGCIVAVATPGPDEGSGDAPMRSFVLLALLVWCSGVCLTLLLLHVRMGAIAADTPTLGGWGGVLWPVWVTSVLCAALLALDTTRACYLAVDTREGAASWGMATFGSADNDAAAARQAAVWRTLSSAAAAVVCVVLFIASINACIALDAADAGHTQHAASSAQVVVGGIDVVAFGAFGLLGLAACTRCQRAHAARADTGALPTWAALGR